jgi:hypothetical protein
VRTSAWLLAITLSVAGCGDDSSPQETDGPSSTESTSSEDASTAAGVDASGGTVPSSSTTTSDGGGSEGPGPESSTGEATQGGGDSSSGGNLGDPCGGADVLCDDFEDGLDPAWAYTGAPGNMPSVDDTVARSGGQSLTFPSTDTQGAFVYPTAGLPTANNRVYARIYVRFAQPMSAMGGHVSYLVGADAPSNGAEMRLGASTNFGSGDVMVDVNLLGSGPEYTQFSNGDVTGGAPSDNLGVVLEAETWYCMEAVFDGENDEFRLSIDGREVQAMHVTDWQQGVTDWSPAYEVIKIGGQNYSGVLGQVWFDDVAISSMPIGCG